MLETKNTEFFIDISSKYMNLPHKHYSRQNQAFGKGQVKAQAKY